MRRQKQQITKEIRTQNGFSCKMIKMQIRLSCTHMTNCLFSVFQISFLAVDDLYEVSLPLVRDRHFEVSIPEIPYTNAAVKSRGKPWQGSASRVR